jgi:ABC-2 type transport system permease protein
LGLNRSSHFLALVLSATAFWAMGALASVAVKEVFEALTLANASRLRMMPLGGVFLPVVSLPTALQVAAWTLPLTYAVEALGAALSGSSLPTATVHLGVLTAFTALFSGLATWALARRLA